MSHPKASQFRGMAPMGYEPHGQSKASRAALAHQYSVRSEEALAATRAAAMGVAARVVARRASRRSRGISKHRGGGLLKRHRKKSRKNRGQRKRAQTRKR